MIGTAIDFYRQGITPIPVGLGSKVATISWKRWQTERPPESLVGQWFAKDCNVGLLMGAVSGGLFCLDFDSMPTWASWKRDHQDIKTRETLTPRPGKHTFLRLPGKTLSTMSLVGLDVKCSGYVVDAGLHPNGKKYKTTNDVPILTIDSLETVLDLDHLVTQYADVGNTVTPPTYTECSDHIANRHDLVGSIKRALPILQAVLPYTEFAAPSSRDNRWYICRCPFHSPDRHPSFWVDAHRNICSCFKPSCRTRQPGGGRPMDTINFYGRLRGLGNRQAILALAAELGV